MYLESWARSINYFRFCISSLVKQHHQRLEQYQDIGYYRIKEHTISLLSIDGLLENDVDVEVV